MSAGGDQPNDPLAVFAVPMPSLGAISIWIGGERHLLAIDDAERLASAMLGAIGLYHRPGKLPVIATAVRDDRVERMVDAARGIDPGPGEAA